VKVDKATITGVVKLLESKPYQLYPDAAEAVITAGNNGFKTAIVTTIAHFKFEKAIQPIRKYLDFVMTGYEAGCDKSNLKMCRKVLEILGVKPEEAIMIGDDMRLDILFPSHLGINTMLWDREGKNRGQSVDAFVYSLNEAMETIIRRYGKN
jgi:putative hydrolase of the HAD superfamily